ncbi:hypothetical protein BGC31_01675 [Komagataeibacter xylinus]|nr:hypothetical protein H845_2750 [Komagataeibacter xylinus E25]RFO99676.1 hypothetical protein BGC31_01675 [Komagataeibacter xylinus]RFP05018.1 hypothetical protein BFX83_00505 [Komagataeibacter xylinus]
MQTDLGIGKFLDPVGNCDGVDVSFMRNNATDEKKINRVAICALCFCRCKSRLQGNGEIQIATSRINRMTPLRCSPQCDELIIRKF